MSSRVAGGWVEAANVAAFVEDPDLIAISVDFVELAAGDEDGRASAGESAHQGIELGLRADAEAAAGLVEQQQATAF